MEQEQLEDLVVFERIKTFFEKPFPQPVAVAGVDVILSLFWFHYRFIKVDVGVKRRKAGSVLSLN